VKVLLFGATGMVGQGVLRECLLDADVERVVALVRSPTGQTHEKLREVVHQDFFDYAAVGGELEGHDACFFCLGVSSAGMKEAQYTRLTYDLTLAAARAVVERSPGATFIYVSGAGTAEGSSSMWARVKGKTESALLALPFRRAYMFRPAFIQPQHGIKSKTRLYRLGYAIATPIAPLMRVLAPGMMTTTEKVGRAMLRVAREGAATPVIENRDINELGA
jgi:uncharacterized protein YbjT (DUF2867 family)